MLIFCPFFPLKVTKNDAGTGAFLLGCNFNTDVFISSLLQLLLSFKMMIVPYRHCFTKPVTHITRLLLLLLCGWGVNREKRGERRIQCESGGGMKGGLGRKARACGWKGSEKKRGDCMIESFLWNHQSRLWCVWVCVRGLLSVPTHLALSACKIRGDEV